MNSIGPDDALIAACDLFISLETLAAGVLHEAAMVGTHEHDALGEAAKQPYLDRQKELVKEIQMSQAVTIEGIRAKARVAVAREPDLLTDSQYEDQIILGSMLRDLIGAPAI